MERSLLAGSDLACWDGRALPLDGTAHRAHFLSRSREPVAVHTLQILPTHKTGDQSLQRPSSSTLLYVSCSVSSSEFGSVHFCSGSFGGGWAPSRPQGAPEQAGGRPSVPRTSPSSRNGCSRNICASCSARLESARALRQRCEEPRTRRSWPHGAGACLRLPQKSRRAALDGPSPAGGTFRPHRAGRRESSDAGTCNAIRRGAASDTHPPRMNRRARHGPAFQRGSAARTLS